MAATKDEATIEDLKAQIDKLQKDMADLIGVVGGLGRTAASRGEAAARDGARQAGEAAGALEASAVAFVRDKPAQSLLIAAGLGLVAGLLSRR